VAQQFPSSNSSATAHSMAASPRESLAALSRSSGWNTSGRAVTNALLTPGDNKFESEPM
jgi:hypothetical protein